ncbi:hypothetical protein [Helicobacter rodentium]|nr:hypothetical protein [Helicobacter rodentium]
MPQPLTRLRKDAVEYFLLPRAINRAHKDRVEIHKEAQDTRENLKL